MSEYRRAYEYEEERGITGFVLVFFIMLLTMELLLGAATTVQGYRALKDTQVLGTMVLSTGSAYLLLTVATSIALRKSIRLGVALSRVLLVVRIPVMVPIHVFLYVSLAALGSGPVEPSSPVGILVTRLIAPVGYIVVFSAGWYVYFLKSKKVRQLLESTRKQG